MRREGAGGGLLVVVGRVYALGMELTAVVSGKGSVRERGTSGYA